MKKLNLQINLIKIANQLAKNALFKAEDFCHLLAEDTDELGKAFVRLADFEKEEYSDHILPGANSLVTAQVSLQRLEMDEKQLIIERLIDSIDRYYLSIFDRYQVGTSEKDITFLVSQLKSKQVFRFVDSDLNKQIEESTTKFLEDYSQETA